MKNLYIFTVPKYGQVVDSAVWTGQADLRGALESFCRPPDQAICQS
jgi:hypothetical protein